MQMSQRVGHIDFFNNQLLGGWAYDDSVEVCTLVLFIDDIYICEIVPTLIRADIIETLNIPSHVKTGFVVEVETNYIATSVKINITFKNTNQQLVGSPFTVKREFNEMVFAANTQHLFDTYNNIQIVNWKTKISSLKKQDTIITSVPLSTRYARNLMYVAYSNNDIATSSPCNDNILFDKKCIFIKQKYIEQLQLFRTFNEFMQHVLLQGIKHVECTNTTIIGGVDDNVSSNSTIDFYIQCKRSNVLYQYMRHKKLATSRNILFLLSTLDGGTPQTTLDLIRELTKNNFNCYILHSNGNVLTLYQNTFHLPSVDCFYLKTKLTPLTHSSAEYDSIFLNILYTYNIDVVHVRHICWHSLSLTQATKFFNIPLIYSLHDFYTVCPSHNLLDESNNCCYGKCTVGSEGAKCQSVLWKDNYMPPLKHQFIHQWQTNMALFLQRCDVLITTTQSAVKIYEQCYSFIQNKILCIEHGRDLNYTVPTLHTNKKLVVIVPGFITTAKGAHDIFQLKELDVSNDIQLHFVGSIPESLQDCGAIHGVYDRDNINSIVQIIKPDIACVLSIWPETYSHILTEMWMNGVPTICYNMGAQAERTQKHKTGWVVERNPRAVYDLLMQIKNDETLLKSKHLGIKQWHLMNINTTENMAQKYIDVYTKALVS